MEIQGKILEIGKTEQIKDTFQKREFVVEYAENPTYPEYIKFEMIQDKCSIMDSFQVNDDVKVSFNLKGRKWTNPEGQVKYFNSLQAWRVEQAGMAATQPPAMGGQEAPPPPPAPISGPDEDDVLPF